MTDGGTALPTTSQVGVVGCGTMGAGIAQVALTAGHPVAVYDVSAASMERAVHQIQRATQRQVDKGRLDESRRADMLQRLSLAPSLADLKDCGLVVEAAAEDLNIKQSIFTELEQACAGDALLATNTSSISVTAIAGALQHPDRVLGMHFFNPAPVMRLVEIVSGLQSDPAALATGTATAKAWGKVAVQVASTPGFVVNRVARPFYGEALRVLHERACDTATVDSVVRESGGFRMGPFELMDLIGLDVNLAVTRSVWTAFHQDPRYTPALEQEELVAAGYLGRKSGRGWYDHGEEAARRAPATEPDRRPPAHVSVGATAGYLTPLIERLRGAGVDVRMPGPDDAIRLPDGGELRLTDGRTATAVAVEVGGPVVLLDLSLDPATATRFAVSASDGCPDPVLHAAVGLLQQTGAAVSVLDDVPGLVVARTVAMLVNEAADVVGTGVATPQQVDLAMLHGVNYPMGPLEWGERWGARPVVQLLDHLADTYRDGHYRAAPSLRRRSLAHGEGS